MKNAVNAANVIQLMGVAQSVQQDVDSINKQGHVKIVKQRHGVMERENANPVHQHVRDVKRRQGSVKNAQKGMG